MPILNLTSPIRADQDDDNYYDAYDQGGVPRKINLTSLSYYASLGMKPLRIGTLVGTTHTHIWATYALRTAYETGAALHELLLRQAAMEASVSVGGAKVALDMLNRSAGVPDVDYNQGLPKEDRAAAPVWTIVAPVLPKKLGLSDSERQEIEGIEE